LLLLDWIWWTRSISSLYS